MGYRLEINSLTYQHQKDIRQHLLFTPTKSFTTKHSNGNTAEPIAMYKKSADGKICLPYRYCQETFAINEPNQHLDHPIVDFDFTKTLFETQKPLVEQAYHQLEEYGTTTLNVYTGAGKTVMCAYLASQLECMTLVMVHRDILAKQWIDTFENFTDASVWVVGEDVPTNPSVVICMSTRFHKLPDEYVSNFGTLIIDEAHSFCTDTRIQCVLGSQPRYVIAASATMKRTDGLIGVITSVCGEHRVVKISTKPFQVIKYNTGIAIPIEPSLVTGRPDWNKVVAQQCASKERNDMIVDIVEKRPKDKILIITWRNKDHVIPLHKRLVAEGIKADYMSGTKKTYSDSRVLLGTISKIGTGFDEKAACEDFMGFRINVLIMVGSMSDVGLLEQVAGRAFRADFPIIYHFVDENKISQNHWKKAVKWYESRNGKIKTQNSPLKRSYNKRQREKKSKRLAMSQTQRLNENGRSVNDKQLALMKQRIARMQKQLGK